MSWNFAENEIEIQFLNLCEAIAKEGRYLRALARVQPCNHPQIIQRQQVVVYERPSDLQIMYWVIIALITIGLGISICVIWVDIRWVGAIDLVPGSLTLIMSVDIAASAPTKRTNILRKFLGYFLCINTFLIVGSIPLIPLYYFGEAWAASD